MKKIFFDTWGWVAIASKEDNYHGKVFSFYKDFLLKKGVPVTTDYVLSETITLLKTRTEIGGVIIFIDAILNAVNNGKIILQRVDDKRWQKAWSLCKKYKDKPGISFVDFSSIIVMKELNIKEILTKDTHFKNVGLGFSKLF